mgnify:CR=1 FL=1
MAPALAARANRCKPSAKRDLRSASHISGSYGMAILGVTLATSAGTSVSLRSPYLREWASQMSPALNASRKWHRTATSQRRCPSSLLRCRCHFEVRRRKVSGRSPVVSVPATMLAASRRRPHCRRLCGACPAAAHSGFPAGALGRGAPGAGRDRKSPRLAAGSASGCRGVPDRGLASRRGTGCAAGFGAGGGRLRRLPRRRSTSRCGDRAGGRIVH